MHGLAWLGCDPCCEANDSAAGPCQINAEKLSNSALGCTGFQNRLGLAALGPSMAKNFSTGRLPTAKGTSARIPCIGGIACILYHTRDVTQE